MYTGPSMSVKGGAPRAYWILSGLLCLCTLVALWIVAWKVRQDKVAARSAGRQESASVDGPRRLLIPRGKAGLAGHFKVSYPGERTLSVFDLNARHLATFPGFADGEVRAWQELRMKWIAGDATSAVVEVEFRPSSPCVGVGVYADLKPGLRVELSPDVQFSVERWDPDKPEIFLVGPSGSAGLAEGGVAQFPPFRARLLNKLLHVERN